jgi:lipopolysaccharide export system permease protein
VKILRRYLLREHLAPFLFALGALTGLLILNQLAKQFSNLIGKGLPWTVIGAVFGLSLPFILAMTLPMAVLVAVLHAFSRLGADSEITALKASGVNLARLARALLLAAAAVAVCEFLFLDQVLPRANHRLKNLLVDIARKKPTVELREQMVN